MRFCLCVVGKSFKSGGSKPWVGEGDGAMEMGCIEKEIGPLRFDLFGGGGGGLSLIFFRS